MKTFKAINQFDSTLFDTLRGASALFVLVGHIYQFLIAPSYQLDTSGNIASFIFSQLAVLSVMVFFVLSGFMITASIYRNTSSTNFERFDAKQFFKDRLIRLYPPLIFALFLTVGLYAVAVIFELKAVESFRNGAELYLVRERLELDTANILASVVFLQNFYNVLDTPSMNSPLWSLSHEFWFYVLAALMVQSYFKKSHSIPLILLLLIAVFSDEKVMFIAGFFIWLSGAALAMMYFNDVLTNRKIRGFVIFGTIMLFAIYSFFVMKRESHLFLYGGKFVFGLLFTFTLAFIVSIQKHHIESFQQNRIVTFFSNSARYSYTLYLIHAPILLFLLAIFHELILFKPVYYLGLSVLAGVSITVLSSYLASYLEDKNYITYLFQRFKLTSSVYSQNAPQSNEKSS